MREMGPAGTPHFLRRGWERFLLFFVSIFITLLRVYFFGKRCLGFSQSPKKTNRPVIVQASTISSNSIITSHTESSSTPPTPAMLIQQQSQEELAEVWTVGAARRLQHKPDPIHQMYEDLFASNLSWEGFVKKHGPTAHQILFHAAMNTGKLVGALTIGIGEGLILSGPLTMAELLAATVIPMTWVGCLTPPLFAMLSPGEPNILVEEAELVGSNLAIARTLAALEWVSPENARIFAIVSNLVTSGLSLYKLQQNNWRPESDRFMPDPQTGITGLRLAIINGVLYWVAAGTALQDVITSAADLWLPGTEIIDPLTPVVSAYPAAVGLTMTLFLANYFALHREAVPNRYLRGFFRGTRILTEFTGELSLALSQFFRALVSLYFSKFGTQTDNNVAITIPLVTLLLATGPAYAAIARQLESTNRDLHHAALARVARFFLEDPKTGSCEITDMLELHREVIESILRARPQLPPSSPSIIQDQRYLTLSRPLALPAQIREHRAINPALIGPVSQDVFLGFLDLHSLRFSIAAAMINAFQEDIETHRMVLPQLEALVSKIVRDSFEDQYALLENPQAGREFDDRRLAFLKALQAHLTELSKGSDAGSNYYLTHRTLAMIHFGLNLLIQMLQDDLSPKETKDILAPSLSKTFKLDDPENILNMAPDEKNDWRTQLRQAIALVDRKEQTDFDAQTNLEIQTLEGPQARPLATLSGEDEEASSSSASSEELESPQAQLLMQMAAHVHPLLLLAALPSALQERILVADTSFKMENGNYPRFFEVQGSGNQLTVTLDQGASLEDIQELQAKTAELLHHVPTLFSIKKLLENSAAMDRMLHGFSHR